MLRCTSYVSVSAPGAVMQMRTGATRSLTPWALGFMSYDVVVTFDGKYGPSRKFTAALAVNRGVSRSLGWNSNRRARLPQHA